MLNRLYSRYVAASAAALSVDFATFLAMLQVGMPPAIAAAVGYVAGIACHWILSSRLVFVGRVSETPAARRQQQALFLGSALVGLAVTTAIVGLSSHFLIDPRLAKIIAIGVSFQVTYVLRKKVVFA
jgi:putative flippase GtrA